LTVETVVITACWWRGCGVICHWWPRPSLNPLLLRIIFLRWIFFV